MTSSVIDFPDDTAVADDELQTTLLGWRDKYPFFMDGSRMFGLGDPVCMVTPQFCLEWVLTRMATRYREVPGVAALVARSSLEDVAACMTAEEVRSVGEVIWCCELSEVTVAEKRRAEVTRLSEHPEYGTW